MPPSSNDEAENLHFFALNVIGVCHTVLETIKTSQFKTPIYQMHAVCSELH